MLLDTDVVSELMRVAPSAQVLRWVDARPTRELFVSAVTEAEIRTGIAFLPEGAAWRRRPSGARERGQPHLHPGHRLPPVPPRHFDRSRAQHGGPTLVISTGAVRSTADPLSSFRPEPCAARRTHSRHFDRSRAQHGVVEKPPCQGGRGGFSTARLRRSRRNDGGGCPWGREFSPLRASGAPVEMTGGGCPWGREVSPLRACGAPVEMTGEVAHGAGRFLHCAPPALRSK